MSEARDAGPTPSSVTDEVPAVSPELDSSDETPIEPPGSPPTTAELEDRDDPVPPSGDTKALAGALAEAPTRQYGFGCGTSKPCRNLSIAGVVVGSAGLGAVIAGSVMLALPDQVIPETPIYVRSTRPAGIVALTLGIGVTITAVLMEIAAHTRDTKPSQSARAIVLQPGGLRF